MTPSLYDTLPVPESSRAILPLLEELIHPAWMKYDGRDHTIHRHVRVWALYVAGDTTLDEIGRHLHVSRERIRQIVDKIQHAIDGLTIPDDVAYTIEYHLGRSREEDVIHDDRIHATQMIVSNEDHESIESCEYRDCVYCRMKAYNIKRGVAKTWYGITDTMPRFGHTEDQRLQRNWYDRIQKSYWYEPQSKSVYERA